MIPYKSSLLQIVTQTIEKLDYMQVIAVLAIKMDINSLPIVTFPTSILTLFKVRAVRLLRNWITS